MSTRSIEISPLVAAAFVVICFLVWLGLEIPKGSLTNSDELFTAERTREMLLTTPWTVHFNFEPSFEKPPLQYWLTMLTLPRMQNRTLAARIWPFFYGALTLIAIGWLASIVDPTKPWLVPLSMAVLAACPLFSAESARALLDIGLAFFATLAIMFALLARKRPVWWLGVALACWLSGLQKFPVVFLIWLLIVLVRFCAKDERRTLRSGWLMVSFVLAVVATSIWPVVQIYQYGMAPGALFKEEVVVWLGPEHLGARPYFEIPRRLFTHGGVCVFTAFLAAFVLLFWKRRELPGAAREIAIVCLSVIGLAIVFNFRSVRYIIPIIPCLCFLLALLLYQFLNRAATRSRAIVFLIVILSAGFVHAEIQICSRRKNLADEKRIAEELGARQSEGTRTVLIKAPQDGTDLSFDSFYLFHGNLRYPVTRYTVEQIRQAPPPPPVLGVCVQHDFPAIEAAYPNVRIELRSAQFICWRVD